MPSQQECLAEWVERICAGPVYQKTTLMHARRATEAGKLETIIDGVVETTKTYRRVMAALLPCEPLAVLLDCPLHVVARETTSCTAPKASDLP